MTWLDETGWKAEQEQDLDRQTASLAAVAVTLLLLVIGLYLVHELHNTTVIEDCLLSGRTNCMVISGS